MEFSIEAIRCLPTLAKIAFFHFSVGVSVSLSAIPHDIQQMSNGVFLLFAFGCSRAIRVQRNGLYF